MGALTNVTNFLKPTSQQGLLVLGFLTLITVVHPLLGLLTLLLTAVLCQARENYGVLEKCGIPVMKPTLFFGSEPTFHKTVLHLADIDRFHKYGGIWGSYVGRQPQIFVVDPELIKLVMVKDFVHFGDRQEYDLGTPYLDQLLDFVPGEKWKQLRTCLSPVFTTSKLNKMSDVIAKSADIFIGELREECDMKGRLKVDCRKRVSTWLIDMFAKVSLGIELEDSKNPDNKFAQGFRDLLGEHQEHNWLFSLSLCYPILTRFAPVFNPAPADLLADTFRQVIESRKQSRTTNTKDFLDVLCDMWERTTTKEYQELGITEDTVIAQAVTFFIGGFETTSSTLTHLLLYLAENPDVQEKMHDELMEALARSHDKNEDNKESDEEETTSLEINRQLVEDSEIPYILACINETLRLAPSVYRTERICTRDWTHKGISIKKGTVIMMPTWAANRNPQVFPDEPSKFKPERFLPENKAKLNSYAFTTFGFGPRNCIGMRFAYENMKLFVCNFIKIFRVEKRADTQMKYKPGVISMIGFDPVYFDLVLRD